MNGHFLPLSPIELVQALLQGYRLGRSQCQLDALPILAAGIFQHCPCLQVRLVISIDDDFISRFPDRRRHDIGQADGTAVLHTVHLDIDGARAVVLAASDGCRGFRDLRSQVGIFKPDGGIFTKCQRLHRSILVDNSQQVSRGLLVGLPRLDSQNVSFDSLAAAGDRYFGALQRCQKRRHG